MTDAWKVDKRKQGKTQGEHLGRLCDNLEKKWWLGSGEAWRWQNVVRVCMYVKIGQ